LEDEVEDCDVEKVKTEHGFLKIEFIDSVWEEGSSHQ
jgi:hypothetical protein